VSVNFNRGWDRFTKAILERESRIKEAQALAARQQAGKAASVKVGVLGAPGSDMATIAATMEYGSPSNNIPARPFMRKTMSSRTLANTVSRVAARYYKGSIDLAQALGMIGVVGVGEVQRSIGSNIPPPNKPRTIKRKKSDRTLIDTGRLRQSISYQVVAGSGDARSTAPVGGNRARRRSKAAQLASRVSKRASRTLAKSSRAAKKAAKKASRVAKKASRAVRKRFK
jgi:hypothetical protein